MRGRYSRRSKACCLAIAISFSSYAPVSADCRSALDSPEWPRIARSIASLQLCEQIPVGPNQTARFQVESVDFCSVSNGVSSVTARALLTCEAEPEALFQTPPLDSQVVATITLDTVECRIRDTNLEISGEIGALLSGLTETQEIARNWAQSQLSLLCAMYR
ncbi:hypothetical protein AM571_PC01604 (plasmid) [Rhizobium etli 8C-3]|uniref:Uncharacterized protein n=2 Tax=Rhizobium TaxID=379 RepID=A0A1L5PGX6_RHIET|nr:hypothetical protein AM571_PC01604 [Rhizobium etli 8C-3]TCU29298.1 hypothetical protein EV130_102480 [Rhizobium azibense]